MLFLIEGFLDMLQQYSNINCEVFCALIVHSYIHRFDTIHSVLKLALNVLRHCIISIMTFTFT